MAQIVPIKQRRGFATWDKEKRIEVARKGGIMAHRNGTAHEWTPEEAREAGRKGGQISRGGRGKLPESAKVSEMRGRKRA